MVKRKQGASYIRNFVFGVEDSLASTAGLLAGVASAGVEGKVIVISGVVLIFVEAFSMGVGSLISENAALEYEKRKESSYRKSALGALIMFLSYILAGFIPLFPYIVFSHDVAFVLSISLSLLTLFVLGAVAARLSGTGILRNALSVLSIGGIAVIVGVLVGFVVK
ncbi:MAG: hypothetical protein COV07_02555 [Candidatus Vogelbacteria bacterium CG10_big_fil_rev_8_21_14_0_10_45_14]|uniref:VIT family protein n=1 Tax=Candidatus Vogelbacteria bacterium CG10_big_fil_rev_8_21_14_0_10_45_14 TaxID=1975042 RepID=A0A2H0RJQ5_9BACT|nr:MAG: hypothetical protein COV07_02555 [Candidatus Vogelbacteria bacterium CG10_big_fil_rev_8_21_14_0_10_45_14]